VTVTVGSFSMAADRSDPSEDFVGSVSDERAYSSVLTTSRARLIGEQRTERLR